MKLVRISDVYGSIRGSCFNDCIATCATDLNAHYQLMYLGALTFKEEKKDSNKLFWERLLFSNNALSNLCDYHGIKLIEEASLSKLSLDCSKNLKSIIELRAFYCPWDEGYRNPQGGTHCLICVDYIADNFQCCDPFYGIINGIINNKEMSFGYCRHFRVEYSSPHKVLTKDAMMNDILGSISCLSKLVNEFKNNNDSFVVYERTMISKFNEIICDISNRTALYCLLLHYCNVWLQLFNKPVDLLLKELYQLYRKWVEIYLKIERFDVQIIFRDFPIDLGKQIENILSEETRILSGIYAAI
ncbi:MAG: hypothetical protein K1W35_00120 [Lachnospiraceae bacterium]